MKIATSPPVLVAPTATVHEACDRMRAANVGAAAVVDNDVLVGIFTERDVMNRVVCEKRDPATTRIADVMTSDVLSAPRDMPYGDALEMMVGKRFRHIPVVDADNKVTGILSVRDLYEFAVERLTHELNGLVNFFSADGPGGD